MLARQPEHLAVGPFALAGHLGRAKLPECLQHAAEQDGPVHDLIAQALQRLGQTFEGQPGIGRDEVQVKGDAFHAASCGPAARCSSRSQVVRRALSSRLPHWAISSRVRQQPSHRPLAGWMRQTEGQGEGKTEGADEDALPDPGLAEGRGVIMIQVQIREGERREGHEPEAPISEVDRPAKREGHQRGKVDEGGNVNGGDAPTGGQQEKSKGERHGMNSSQPHRPRAQRVWFADGLLHVELADGRTVSARYEMFPRLVNATPAQRDHWEIIGAGVGIHWPDVDEDLSTDGLVRDAVAITSLRGVAV